MERCRKCRKEVAEATAHCPHCGHRFVAMPAPVAAEEPGLYYCYRHPKEATRLSCGRCERPLCTRCAIIGDNGPRCRDCSRNRVPVRARGVAHDLGNSVARVPTCQRVWYVAMIAFVVNLFSSFFGGRRDL